MPEETREGTRPDELPGGKPDIVDGGAGADRRNERSEPGGLALLEDDAHAITVAAYAGDRYQVASEVARVRIELAGRAGAPVGRVTELSEAPAARGSDALADALARAEEAAWQRGVRKLEYRLAEAQMARLDPAERDGIVRALQQRGFAFRASAGTTPLVAGREASGAMRPLEASKDLQAERPKAVRPAQRPQPREPERTEVAPPPAERHLEAGSPPGLQILEESREGITVAAYAGASYSLTGEVARVRLECAPPGAPPVARVVEFSTSGPETHAVRAGKDALDLAVARARQWGMELVEFHIGEQACAARPLQERVALIGALQEDWWQVLYETRLPNGERQLISQPGGSQVVGEPLSLRARDDLTAEHPSALERLDSSAVAQFGNDLAQALHGEPPAELHLPLAVEARLEELWRWSMAQPERPEWAATLVVNEAGELVAAHAVTGSPGGVTPETPSSGEELIGYLHIHPYESGLTDMAFSGRDFAAFLRERGDIVEIVRSGDGVFALVKTRASRHIGWQWAAAGVERGINREFEMVYESIGDLEGDATPDLNAQNAAIAVNQETCARYGLALYAGRAGRPLQRIYP